MMEMVSNSLAEPGTVQKPAYRPAALKAAMRKAGTRKLIPGS
jgi:hypothetical protein